MIVCPKEGNYIYPHPTKCDWFVECNKGKYAEIRCIVDLVFDPDILECNFPEHVQCPVEGILQLKRTYKINEDNCKTT